MSERISGGEQASTAEGVSKASSPEQVTSGASERANGRASGPVLLSGFLIIMAYCVTANSNLVGLGSHHVCVLDSGGGFPRDFLDVFCHWLIFLARFSLIEASMVVPCMESHP